MIELHPRGSPAGAAAPERITPWAVAAVVCGAFIFCPVAGLIAPLLGLKAIAEIRSRPGVGGMGLAIAGIVVGLLSVVIWIALAAWWHVNVRVPIMQGPIDEIRAGLAGDAAAFRAGFTGRAAEANDEEVFAFLSEMTGRYGVLERIEVDDSPGADASGEHRFHALAPYVFHFDSGDAVSGRVEMLFFADGLRPRWLSITLDDEVRGDLEFP